MNTNEGVKPNAKTVSLGFTRDDGDFQVLATLSNTVNVMDDEVFKLIVASLRDSLDRASETYIEVKERADAADVVTLG